MVRGGFFVEDSHTFEVEQGKAEANTRRRCLVGEDPAAESPLFLEIRLSLTNHIKPGLLLPCRRVSKSHEHRHSKDNKVSPVPFGILLTRLSEWPRPTLIS
jgi:hypothetical protein